MGRHDAADPKPTLSPRPDLHARGGYLRYTSRIRRDRCFILWRQSYCFFPRSSQYSSLRRGLHASQTCLCTQYLGRRHCRRYPPINGLGSSRRAECYTWGLEGAFTRRAECGRVATSFFTICVAIGAFHEFELVYKRGVQTSGI